MLPELLAMYRSRGVHFIGLPEALADPAYRDDPDIGDAGGGGAGAGPASHHARLSSFLSSFVNYLS